MRKRIWRDADRARMHQNRDRWNEDRVRGGFFGYGPDEHHADHGRDRDHPGQPRSGGEDLGRYGYIHDESGDMNYPIESGYDAGYDRSDDLGYVGAFGHGGYGGHRGGGMRSDYVRDRPVSAYDSHDRTYWGGDLAYRRGGGGGGGGGMPGWQSQYDTENFDRGGAGPSQRGRGPKGYARSDSRILEDVSDSLSDDHLVDASEIDVGVENGEVTLSGTVDSRAAKRRAEDCIAEISGVRHVQNNLRVDMPSGPASGPGQSGQSSGGNR